MRKLLFVVAVAGCWTSKSTPPPADPQPAPVAKAAPPPAPAPRVVQEDPPVDDAGQPVPQGGAFASLTGTGDISSGFDDTDVYGGLGSGAGGGGTGWGTIGTGRYGTIGQGSGTGSGYGVGGGRGGLRGKSAPTISIGQPSTSSTDLDKAIVRRYIKRNIQKLTYCYEKRLLDKPTLQGTITAKFTIGGDGNVSASTASGLDTEVDQCVADVIKGIQFPKPKTGSALDVKYPFTFRPQS